MSGSAIIRAILEADDGVLAIVGDPESPPGDPRIFYTVAPQGAALPYVVILKGGLEEQMMLSGSSQWPEERILMLCHGVNFPAAEALGNACVAATRDRNGTFAGKSATVWRDNVEASDYLPATRSERRIVGAVVRWK